MKCDNFFFAIEYKIARDLKFFAKVANVRGNAQLKAAHTTESDVHYCMKANISGKDFLSCSYSPIYYYKERLAGTTFSLLVHVAGINLANANRIKVSQFFFLFLQLTVLLKKAICKVAGPGQCTIAIMCIAYGSSPCMQIIHESKCGPLLHSRIYYLVKEGWYTAFSLLQSTKSGLAMRP